MAYIGLLHESVQMKGVLEFCSYQPILLEKSLYMIRWYERIRVGVRVDLHL